MKLSTAIENIGNLSDAGQKAALRSLTWSFLGRFSNLYKMVIISPKLSSTRQSRTINIDAQTEEFGLSPEMLMELTAVGAQEVISACESKGITLSSRQIMTLAGSSWIPNPVQDDVDAFLFDSTIKALPKGASESIIFRKAEILGITPDQVRDMLKRTGQLGMDSATQEQYASACVRTFWNATLQSESDADLLEVSDTFILDALVKARKKFAMYDRIDEATLILLGDDIKQAEKFA